MEPEKPDDEASRRSISSAINSFQQLHPPSAGACHNGCHQHDSHHRSHRSGHSSSSYHNNPHFDQRRRSAFVFGQSLILDHQNPEWQFTNDFGNHHHVPSQRCYCSRGFISPWRYREGYLNASNTPGVEDQNAILSIVGVEGYQTLPSHMPAWQDGSDCGTPPCPPLRTSSKLKPPLLSSYFGERNSTPVTMRPTSFPNVSIANFMILVL